MDFTDLTTAVLGHFPESDDVVSADELVLLEAAAPPRLGHGRRDRLGRRGVATGSPSRTVDAYDARGGRGSRGPRTLDFLRPGRRVGCYQSWSV